MIALLIAKIFVIISFTFVFIIAMKNQWGFASILFGFALLLSGANIITTDYNNSTVEEIKNEP